MSVTVEERHVSPEATVARDSSSATVKYWANGSSDYTTTYAAVVSVVPTSYGNYKLTSIRLDFQGGTFWFAFAEYEVKVGDQNPDDEPPEQPDSDAPLGPEFSWSTSGGTEHVTQSLSTLSKTGRGAIVPFDNKKAIGLTKDSVEGVDKVSPKFEFQYTSRRLNTTIAYMKQLADATGSYNLETWMGFEPRTLLFLGAEGAYEGNGTAHAHKITYKFAYSPNLTDVAICDGLSVPEKPGWHYLWATYEDSVNGNFVYQIPSAAYVEQIYYGIGFRDALGF